MFAYNDYEFLAKCTIKIKGEIKMSCCRIYNLRPESITVTDGVATITVADGALDAVVERCDRPEVAVCINTHYPTDTECFRVELTDGTNTLPYVRCNQYFKIQRFLCGSKIRAVFLPYPKVLAVI